MTESENFDKQASLEFSKETILISGGRKLYVYDFHERSVLDLPVSSTGNISLEGTKTDD